MNVTDLETGQVHTQTCSRCTGNAHPVRSGWYWFVDLVAGLNSYGNMQGLPLFPESIPSAEVLATDDYDDVLSKLTDPKGALDTGCYLILGLQQIAAA